MSKTKKEMLQELIAKRNPMSGVTMIKGEPGIQGEPGKTPIKGVDYYTEQEINSIINYIQSSVKHGEKGDIGEKGNSIKGDTGYSPKKGIDYWTTKDQEKIIREVLAKIPTPKENKPINIDEVIQTVKDSIPRVNFKDEIGKILNTPGMRMLLHGGGLTSVAHDATMTGDGTPGNPLKVINAGASAFTDLTDVPHTYTGQSGKAAVVNGTEDGLVFSTVTGTDEKVKYDASDPTAGYIVDKIISGTGISVAEGTGANENKLVVTNSAPDQTVSINAGTNITSVTGTYPNFTINAATQTSSGDMLKATYDPANISEQLVGLTATQSLTNKTLNSNTNYIDADATHQKVFLNLGRAGVIGDPVYVSGWNVANSCSEVSLARANSQTTLPCAGVLESAGADGTVQSIRVEGILPNANTNAWSAGTRLYVSATTAGVLTSTRPTTPNFNQAIATVSFQHATNGILDVIRTAYVGTMAYADTASYQVAGSYQPLATVLTNTTASYTTTIDTRLANTSGTNTGDNATNSQYSGLASSKQDTLTLTTTGTSGAATLVGATLNIPQYSGGSGMVYPGAGIPLSTGSAWGTSITDNSTNWNTAYTDRNKWDGGSTGLTAATGRTSLGLVIGTDVLAYRTFGTAANNNTGDFYLSTNPSGFTSNTGTVTSVAAITLGTTGTDLTSTVANGTTTPVITLNVPTASASNRGALSAADWTTFNNKLSSLSGALLADGTVTGATSQKQTFTNNIATPNVLEGYTTTVTSATPLTLLVGSNNMQYLTGSTTQTVVMPVTSTLVLGQSYWIVNLSSAVTTVNSSGGNAIIVLPANTSTEITCILTSGTTAASWNAQYFGDVYASGKKFTVNNTLTLAGTDGTTMTFPGATTTVAGLGTTQTFTGANTFNNASVLAGAATMALFNTTATNISFAGAATTLAVGGTPTTAITHSYSANATATGTTKTVNIATGGAAGSTTNTTIGSANGGTTTVSSPALRATALGLGKGASASIRHEILTDATYTQGVRVEGDTVGRLGFSGFVTGDSFVRSTLGLDGKFEWGSGTLVADTNLYRSGANILKTDDTFVAMTGIELGHDTDTTLTRVSAGVAAIEGNNILTTASTLDATKISGAIPSAVTATTQAANDNSTKVATTAYADSVATHSLQSATTIVDVAAATAPTTGQILTATDSTHATWQTPAAGGGVKVPPQNIPVIQGNINNTYYAQGIKNTSTTDGLTMFMVLPTSGTGATIYQYTKDSNTGNYFRTANSTTFTFDNNSWSAGQGGMAISGIYLYIFSKVSSTMSIKRYALSDLSGVTTMTISGTTTTNPGVGFSDGSNLYVSNGGGATFYKYSISGTTVTYVTSISYTGADGGIIVASAIGNSSYVWIASNYTSPSNSYPIRKYNLTGGAVLSTTTPYLVNDINPGNSITQIFITETSTLALIWMYNMYIGSTINGIMANINTITLP